LVPRRTVHHEDTQTVHGGVQGRRSLEAILNAFSRHSASQATGSAVGPGYDAASRLTPPKNADEVYAVEEGTQIEPPRERAVASERRRFESVVAGDRWLAAVIDARTAASQFD